LTDVFNSNANGEGTATPASASPEGSLDQTTFDFIGEGKQYASPEVALAAIPHKDSHIAKLERENAALREKTENAQTVQQILDAMKGEAQSTNNANESTVANQPQDVSDVVRSVLQEEQAKTVAENNVSSVNAELAKRFGADALSATQKRAAELGIEMAAMQAIAEKSPSAFLAMFPNNGSDSGVQDGTQHVMGSEGDVNTSSSTLNTSLEEGTEAYYKDLKKTDPKAFMSRDVQIAKMRAAIENPEKYFGQAA